MGETRPQKRLVSKRQYVQYVGKNLALGSVSVLTLTFAIICTIASLSLFCIVVGPHSDWEARLLLLAFVAASSILWTIGLRTKKNVESSPPVVPITNQNAHLLSAEESLLRGSDLPPTIQQAELLRATQAAQETPQEELLRSSTREE